MRTQVLVLVLMIFPVTGSCETTRLDRIHPGMTQTDVAIELGKPADTRVEDEATLWLYPASETKICTIRFIKHRVSTESIKCDSSEGVREFASRAARDLVNMNSEKEYQDRLLRYCGIRPSPRPGCKISPQCINGGWDEICR